MKIKALRKERKLSQTELAKNLNLTKNQILRFENGKTPVPSDILIKMSEFFDVSLDFLCDKPFNNKIGYVPEDKIDTVKKLLMLKDKDLDRVDAYITALIESNNETVNR